MLYYVRASFSAYTKQYSVQLCTLMRGKSAVDNTKKYCSTAELQNQFYRQQNIHQWIAIIHVQSSFICLYNENKIRTPKERLVCIRFIWTVESLKKPQSNIYFCLRCKHFITKVPEQAQWHLKCPSLLRMRNVIAGYQHHSMRELRLRRRRAFSVMPVPAFRGKAKHTLGELFHCTYSGTSYCTLVWPAQPCLCQEILPACLWAQTALCKALSQPGNDLCTCSVVPPSFHLAFPSSPLWQLQWSCIWLWAKNYHFGGRGCAYVCLRKICAGSAHWCSQLHSCALLKLIQRRKDHTSGPRAFFGLNSSPNHILWVVLPVISHPA